MSKIIVNVEDDITRAAILEKGKVAELYIEREDSKRIVGNIYKGIVTNVLPGMQSAFVDIGIDKDVFLYIGDLKEAGLKTPPEEEEESSFEDEEITPVSITDVLHSGQEIIVQIFKEAIGTKGARGTTSITLPGRYLVLMPNCPGQVFASKRIEDEEEKERLKTIAREICPDEFGVIVRTIAEGKGKEELEHDLNFLLKLWAKIQKRIEYASPYSLVHKDLNILLKITRDFFTEEVEEMVVDNEEAYNMVIDFLKIMSENFISKVRLYRDSIPIFTKYGIESEIEKALVKRVWLKSGGYIIIEQTEALTSIDVNTGKFVGSQNLEETVFKTNIEAADEIVRQVRLRDIGGIIVIDFIDMKEEEHRLTLQNYLLEAFKRDRTKTKIFEMNELGLILMTRKRVKRGLWGIMKQHCPYCKGEGKVLSMSFLIRKLIKKLKAYSELNVKNEIEFSANPLIIRALHSEEDETLFKLQSLTGKKLKLKSNEAISLNTVYFDGKKVSLEIE